MIVLVVNTFLKDNIKAVIKAVIYEIYMKIHNFLRQSIPSLLLFYVDRPMLIGDTYL